LKKCAKHVLENSNNECCNIAGPDTWLEPSLLLDCHQLQEERAGTEDASQPSQEELGRWAHFAGKQLNKKLKFFYLVLCGRLANIHSNVGYYMH